MIGTKLLNIRFYKTVGFIRVYNGTRYLVLFGSGKNESIYNRISYLIGVKSDIAYVFSHNACSGCHDLLMMSMNLSNFVILNIHCVDYRCIINGISKNEAINVMQNICFTDKNGTLQIIKITKKWIY